MFIIHCFYVIRAVFALSNEDYINNERLQLYLGSLFRILQIQPFHAETLMAIWSTNYMAVVVSGLTYQLKHFKWMDLIFMLEGKIKPNKLSKILK